MRLWYRRSAKPAAPEGEDAMGCGPFPIIDVRPEWVMEQEALGSKRKFWYRSGDSGLPWLFKYPREGTGEHWSEKIAAEVAAEIGIPHARVELAVYQGDVGSTTLSFAGSGRELVHGNQILAGKVLGYDPDQKFRNSDHTLGNVWRALEAAFLSEKRARVAKRLFAGYLVLDALIGNTDRHHENWGVLRRRVAGEWRCALAPSFDHASSLGRELTDQDGPGKTRARLLNENRLPDYVEKARGGVYWSGDDRWGPSPLELVRRGAATDPDLFAWALMRIARLRKGALEDILAGVPSGWISPSAQKFASELTLYTRNALNGLIR